MTIALSDFIGQLAVNPALRVAALLILGTILVNGWTDAPNAIASLVATGGMKLKPAVRLAAVFNFAGLLVMTAFNSKVAFTIYQMADFGGNPAKALTALCAALSAIIVWAAFAWCFGIPTSESHALIAGISGAAVAVHNGFAGINGQEWVKVIYGLIFSVLFGFSLGCLGGIALKWHKCLRGTDKKCKRYKMKGFGKIQICGAAAMAFMHGAQDGQKFMGVFLLGIFLAGGQGNITDFRIPFWMMALCSATMALGTAIGGERIIKTIGSDMVKLDRPQGFAADMAGAFCLLFATAAGIPVSTTHVKTTAIMGVGKMTDAAHVNTKVVEEMILTWILTFPGCGVIGYLTAKLFAAILNIP